jgi:hypothetical protein
MRLNRHCQHHFSTLKKENLQQGREVINKEREYLEHVETFVDFEPLTDQVL